MEQGTFSVPIQGVEIITEKHYLMWRNICI